MNSSQSLHAWRRWLNTLQPVWQSAQWPLLGALGVLAFWLGFRGFELELTASGGPATPSNVLYLTVQLFTLQYGLPTEPHNMLLIVARFLAPAVGAYAAAQALALVFQEQLLLLRLRGLRGHAIVCGLGQQGWHLAHNLRAAGWPVVVIERDADNDRLNACREAGCLTLIGDASAGPLLRRAQVAHARALVAVCGDDGVNAEIAALARALFGGSTPLTCLLHINDTRLHHLLREQELAADVPRGFRQEFFNRYESGARLLLREHPPFDESGPPHIVVVGLNRFGLSLTAHLARQWHAQTPARGRLRLTLIDPDAERQRQWLAQRYPALERVCEIQVGGFAPDAPEFERAEFLRDPAGAFTVTRAYVCQGDESDGLLAALSLHHALRGHAVPIVAQLTHEGGLARLLRASEGEADTLHGFPLLARVCQAEALLGGTHEVLARAIHADYLRVIRARPGTAQSNPAAVSWEALPEDLRESNRRVADAMMTQLRSVGCVLEPLTDWEAESFIFAPEEIERLAQHEHERWRAEREADGWRYAPGPKDATQRTNPLLVEWAQLPESIRVENRTTITGLPAFLARAGFQVRRMKT